MSSSTEIPDRVPIQEPIQIILCGLNADVGAKVTSHLLPEIHVAKFVQSVEQGEAEIPALLLDQSTQLHSESAPPHPANKSDISTNIQSQNQSQNPIQAIVLGAGYVESLRDRLRGAVVGKPGLKQVPWLAADLEVVKHIGPGKPPSSFDMDWYAAQAAERVKRQILKMMVEDQDGNTGTHAGNSEVYFY